jgi:hypothetical protein
MSEFVYSPCANPLCDVVFASDVYCSICEEERKK